MSGPQATSPAAKSVVAADRAPDVRSVEALGRLVMEQAVRTDARTTGTAAA
jgi:hypothetical protein